MEALLAVRDLHTYFVTRRGLVKAVNGVSIHVQPGETLGLVGESGCGKSVTGSSILRLVAQPAGRIVSGEIIFDGRDLLRLSDAEMRRIRGNRIAMVLQDPMSSLDPLFTIGDQLAEPLRRHARLRGTELWSRLLELLDLVRIPSPDVRLHQYPHQMSGGMRQRVVGAIGIAAGPQLLIADEPTTSLDVTIQAQYLGLLKDLQERMGLAMIFITHDFGIVAHICDRVAVMYAGRVVETAPVRELFNHPAHPYTAALLRSVPRIEDAPEDKSARRLYSIEGQPPSLLALPKGCAFAARCERVRELCNNKYPDEISVATGHTVSCWLTGDRIGA